MQTDTWYPGWTATLDGAPAEILRADFLFRGVVLPAGQHEVSMTYAPARIRAALRVAPLAWLALLAWTLGELRRRD